MKSILLALCALPCLAQIHTLKVYSEFTRIDPFGNVIQQDKSSQEPRHILSPGIPRNAYSSLRIAVTMDKPGKYILDIGQNPENAVKATLYKEHFEKHGGQWIPNGLEPVSIPYESIFPMEGDIPEQKVITFWLDMWVDRRAEVDRIKVEPQVWISSEDDWFTYPMEVRIMETVIPDVKSSIATLPSVTSRADAAVRGPLRAKLCPGASEGGGREELSTRTFIRRNALQYATYSKAQLAERLVKFTGTPLAKWCAADGISASSPEWVLRFRDSLFLIGTTRRD